MSTPVSNLAALTFDHFILRRENVELQIRVLQAAHEKIGTQLQAHVAEMRLGVPAGADDLYNPQTRCFQPRPAKPTAVPQPVKRGRKPKATPPSDLQKAAM